MCSITSHPLSADVDSAIAARVALMNDKTDLRRMFTATDIKMDVRAKVGVQIPVVQSDIRNLVHAKQFDLYNIGYTRISIPTPTGDTLLYLPAGDDEQPYVDSINPNGTASASTNTLPSPNTSPATPAPASQNSISVSGATMSAALVAAVSAAAASTAAPLSVKNQTVDSDYRLPIYGDQLSALGVKPGDSVCIHVYSNKQIEVVDSIRPQSSPYATYMVNADGRIRISGKILDVHLPSAGKTYKVTTSASSIVIEAA